MRGATIIIAAMMLASAAAAADDGKPPSSSTGLSVLANAGGFWASKNNAAFYSGRPEEANTINRVLHSDSYGRQIWQQLVNDGIISPTEIGGYDQLQVVEYPDMYYRTSYQIGLGIRYDYSSGMGWLLRFDLAKLQAIGAFNLGTTSGTGLLGRNQYLQCGMLGREERVNIDVALTYRMQLNELTELELDLGGCLVNTKVKEHLMEIDGATYSILDVWDGRSPDYGTASYEYMNQGGIGYGVFSSLLLGYRVIGVGALRVGYTCYQTRTVLQGHTAWGWQHTLGIRVEMNNFSL